MNKNNNIHLFIGPKMSDNMTISELNGARSLAKYIITRDFSSIEEFNKFCGQFKNEQELLKKVYGKNNPIHELCGEDLTKDLSITAYDKDKNPIPIVYKKELSKEEQIKISIKIKKELNKWDNKRIKTPQNSHSDNDNGLWRPSR